MLRLVWKEKGCFIAISMVWIRHGLIAQIQGVLQIDSGQGRASHGSVFQLNPLSGLR